MKNLFKRAHYAIYILLTCVIGVGCSQQETVKTEYPKQIDERGQYHIIVVDSCEYILREGSSDNQSLAHKGNCKFCDERAKANAR